MTPLGELRLAAAAHAWMGRGCLQVSFEGVGSPHKGDWVGVYSPADADVHSTAPVKWQHADVVRTSHEIKSTRTCDNIIITTGHVVVCLW